MSQLQQNPDRLDQFMEVAVAVKKQSKGDLGAYRCLVVSLGLACCLSGLGSPAKAATCPSKGLTSAYHDATVFRDRKRNGMLDAGEPSCTTRKTGRFKAPPGKGLLTLQGGIEIATGAANPFVFTAPADAGGIGVFSSVSQALANRQSLRQIRRLFGLPKSHSLADYRFVSIAKAKPKTRVLLKKDAQLHTVLHFAHARSGEAVVPLMGEFASALLSAQRPLDLKAAPVIENLLMALPITVSDEELALMGTAASALNTHIENNSDKLNALAGLRTRATDRLRAGDFACLAKCYTDPEIEDQLQGATCLCETPLLPPGIPEITSVQEDTGVSPIDFITKDPTPRLIGTAGGGTTEVTLFRGGTTPLSPAVPVTSGTWSYSFDAALLEDEYTFTAIGKNAAGQESPPSAARTVTVDTTGPSLPGNNGGGEDETLLPGFICPNQQEGPFLIVNGTDGGVPVGATVQEFDGIEIIGKTYPLGGRYATDFDAFTCNQVVRVHITDRLAPASYNVKFFVSDVAGTESCAESIETPDDLCVGHPDQDHLLTINETTPLSIDDPGLTSTTPTLSGEWSGGDPAGLSVSVNGRTYRVGSGLMANRNPQFTWFLEIPTADALERDTEYPITARYEYVNDTKTEERNFVTAPAQ